MAEQTAPAKAPAKKKSSARKRTPGGGTKGRKPSGKSQAGKRAKKAASSAAKKQADKAAEQAKEAGAVGGRLPSAKKQLRDSMIVARVAQGLKYEVIAEEAGVTTRTVETVVAEAKKQSPLDATPMKLLEDLAVGIKLSIGDYEAMALAWYDTNQSAALGAKKAADEARARLATLMADIGKLPSNLELFRSEMEMRGIAQAMRQQMEAVVKGDSSVEEAVEFFRTVVGDRGRPELPAGT